MDIPTVSTAISLSQVKQQAVMSVLKMTLHAAESNGEMLTAMFTETPKAAGNSIQPGLGTLLDTYA